MGTGRAPLGAPSITQAWEGHGSEADPLGIASPFPLHLIFSPSDCARSPRGPRGRRAQGKH